MPSDDTMPSDQPYYFNFVANQFSATKRSDLFNSLSVFQLNARPGEYCNDASILYDAGDEAPSEPTKTGPDEKRARRKAGKVKCGPDEKVACHRAGSSESDRHCSANAASHTTCSSDPERISRLIADAELAFDSDQCSAAHCFTQRLERDLAPFAAAGIDSKQLLVALQRDSATFAQLVRYSFSADDGQLYRSGRCTFPARCSGVEHFLKRIDTSRLVNSTTTFFLNVHDYPLISRRRHSASATPPPAVFSFSKSDQFDDIMYPAWSFHEGGPAIGPYPTGIGQWDEQRRVLQRAHSEWPWNEKKRVAFFRGSRTNAARDALILFSRANPDKVDARYTRNQAWRSPADSLGADPADEVRLEEHCRWRYLLNSRGVAASFRLRHLFLCGSLVLHVVGGGGDEWREFFYDALRPWYHYVPLREDLSDLDETLAFLRTNDETARRIAERGRRFVVRHLRSEDVQSYWQDLLERYSRLLSAGERRPPPVPADAIRIG